MRVAAALLLAVSSACATASAPQGPQARAGRFPTKEELEQLSLSPLPDDLALPRAVELERWPLTGPFPAAYDEPSPAGEGPLAALLVEVAARPGVQRSGSLDCVAREMARYYLTQRDLGSAELRRFIGGACRTAAAAGYGQQALSGEVPDAVTDQELVSRKAEDLRGMLASIGPAQPMFGAALIRGEGRYAVVVVRAAPKARVLAARREGPSDAPEIALELEVQGSYERVRVLVNRGVFGVAPCALMDGVRLPRLVASCPMDGRDARAWIEVSGQPPGRELGFSLLQVLAWSAEPSEVVYSRVSYAEGAGTGVDLAALARGINDTRKVAGLAELVLEEQQSTLATRVTPHFFAATGGRVPAEVADTVALGMLAGWGVGGLVQGAWFTSAVSVDTTTPRGILANALDRPSGREVLLHPAARRLAIGALRVEAPPFLGALFTTYSVLETKPQPELVTQVLELLNRARAAAGAVPADLHRHLASAAEKAAGEVERIGPTSALRVLLNDASDRLQSATNGWVLQTRSLDQLDFPPELLSTQATRVSIAVAAHRQHGDPWARWVVLVVVGQDKSVKTACRSDGIERAIAKL